jgi:hypothetical protein
MTAKEKSTGSDAIANDHGDKCDEDSVYFILWWEY